MPQLLLQKDLANTKKIILIAFLSMAGISLTLLVMYKGAIDEIEKQRVETRQLVK